MENGEPSNDVYDFKFDFPKEKVLMLDSKAKAREASEKIRTEVRLAPLLVRNEGFRPRNENKELRVQICDSRTKLNQSEKYFCYQRSLIIKLQMKLRTFTRRMKTLSLNTNLHSQQPLMLRKPRGILLPFHLRSK